VGGDQDSSFLASKSGETTTLRSGLTDATGHILVYHYITSIFHHRENVDFALFFFLVRHKFRILGELRFMVGKKTLPDLGFILAGERGTW